MDNLGSFSVVVRLNIEIEMLMSTSFNELPVNDIDELSMDDFRKSWDASGV